MRLLHLLGIRKTDKPNERAIRAGKRLVTRVVAAPLLVGALAGSLPLDTILEARARRQDEAATPADAAYALMVEEAFSSPYSVVEQRMSPERRIVLASGPRERMDVRASRLRERLGKPIGHQDVGAHRRIYTPAPRTYMEENRLLRRLVLDEGIHDAYVAVERDGEAAQLTLTEHAAQALERYDTPEATREMLVALNDKQVIQESGWRARVASHSGAQGVLQILPRTAAYYDRLRNRREWDGTGPQSTETEWRKLLSNPALSADLRTYILDDYTRQMNGSVVLGVAAYNAGPGNVRSGKASGFRETRDYVNRILSSACMRVPDWHECRTAQGPRKDFSSLLPTRNG